MKDFLNAMLVVVGIIMVIGLATYGYLYLYRDVAPKFAGVERQVFVATPSFVQGTIRHLTQLESDYRRARDEATRETLRDMIRREASTIDRDQLPADLDRFIKSL